MAENNQANAPAQEQDLSEILKVRREKLAALRAEGRDPNKTTLDELRSLMPTNPDWMNGAKAGIMLGEAIFRKANIKNIIPSDLNLINGVIKEK